MEEEYEAKPSAISGFMGALEIAFIHLDTCGRDDGMPPMIWDLLHRRLGVAYEIARVYAGQAREPEPKAPDRAPATEITDLGSAARDRQFPG